jgi:hypothetical protein
MKYARLGLSVLVAASVGLVLIATRPASGQSQGQPAQTLATSNNRGTDWYFHPSRDPELAKLHAEEGRLEGETAGLVEEYARTQDETQRGKIKAKLTATLEKQFEMQQKRRDVEVAQIEAQLKKLREIMRKRSDSRQLIIDKRLDQLLREAEGLGWTTPPGSTAPRNFNYGYPPQIK